jgi:hypothetical protein
VQIRKTLLALFLAVAVCTDARGAVWTDLWWNPSESGWGVNINHQYSVIFVTFFVYGSDGSARWYSATGVPGATLPSGYSRWDGDLYETRGSYLGAVFNPNASTYRKVGTVAFLPASPYAGTLSYSVDGVAVSKSIQRQTLRHIPLSGAYFGGYSVKQSSCVGVPVGSYGTVDININATNPNSDGVTGGFAATVGFNGVSGCTVSGSYRQFGSLYYIPETVVCSTAGFGNFTFTDFSSSDDGIDGNIWINTGACTVGMGFSAVRR